MQSWQMQEAKARMSELVKRAQTEGPQDITMYGKSVAVVISREAFEESDLVSYLADVGRDGRRA